MLAAKIAGIATAFAVIGISLGAALAEDPINRVGYACKGNKDFHAAYYSDKVELAFPDGTKMVLPQTMSGSGIRYANTDESFVFWSKGNTAFITEGDPDNVTYADCVEME